MGKRLPTKPAASCTDTVTEKLGRRFSPCLCKERLQRGSRIGETQTSIMTPSKTVDAAGDGENTLKFHVP